jgi:hypothetical protein
MLFLKGFLILNFLPGNVSLLLQQHSNLASSFKCPRIWVSEGFKAQGSVFQWIEFQIPILKMQVRFLPGSQNWADYQIFAAVLDLIGNLFWLLVGRCISKFPVPS